MIHYLRAFVPLDCRSSKSSEDQFHITHTTLKINIVVEMSRTHIKMYLPLPWGWHAGGCWRRWETWLLFYLSETEKEWHSFRIQRLKVCTQLAKVQQKLVVSLWVGGLLESLLQLLLIDFDYSFKHWIALENHSIQYSIQKKFLNIHSKNLFIQ